MSENESSSENESDNQDFAEKKRKSFSIRTNGENEVYSDVFCEAAALHFFPHMSISYPPKTVTVTIEIMAELFSFVLFYMQESLSAVTRLFRPVLDRRFQNQFKTIKNKFQSFI